MSTTHKSALISRLVLASLIIGLLVLASLLTAGDRLWPFIKHSSMPQSQSASSQATKTTSRLQLPPGRGLPYITIELALDPASQARGLMFRQKLTTGHGMLFYYDYDHEITMWMKNTFIPLDMIFIRKDGIIHRIVSHTEPFSLEPVSSNGQVRAVLEIAAGEAERLGLRAGDRLKHKLFHATSD